MADPRVLIIDPDGATIKFLTQSLEQDGYQVFSARTAKEGLIIAWRDRPHILIIDPAIKDIPIAELVQKLRHDSRTSHRVYIAFSSLEAPDAIQSMLEMGFDEYIPKEIEALPNLKRVMGLQLAKSSAVPRDSQPLQSFKPVQEGASRNGKVIVFLSAKGGTGTSSICANIANIIARRNQDANVAVIDMVLPLGSISSIVGYDGRMNLVRVSGMTSAETTPGFFRENLNRILRWDFHLLAGPHDPDESEQLNVARVPIIVDTMKQAFDYVIIDLGRSLSRISLPIILAADQVVLVLGVDTATVDLTETIWNFLREKGLQPRQTYGLINRAVGHEGLSKRDIEDRLDLPIHVAIPYTQVNFTLSNNQHIPYVDKFPDDTAALTMLQTANDLKSKTVLTQKTMGNF